MQVYLEYALLQNFCMDCALLFVALRGSGCARSWRIYLSAGVGSLSAVLFPLFDLPPVWTVAYKVGVGVLLPLLAVKKEGVRRTLLCVGLFFCATFFVAGGAFAFSQWVPLQEGMFYQSLPAYALTGVLVASFALWEWLSKRYRRRRRAEEFFVCCTLAEGEREIEARAFIDTGNEARHLGAPVCFVTPDLFARVCKNKREGYATALTVAGTKKIAVVKIARLRITAGERTHIVYGAYLSPSLALVGREYEMLLGAWACA